MKPTYIYKWEDWEELCLGNGLNPLGQLEFGCDKGGGNSDDFEFVGEVPEREDEE